MGLPAVLAHVNLASSGWSAPLKGQIFSIAGPTEDDA
jgi:hypothetical protein